MFTGPGWQASAQDLLLHDGDYPLGTDRGSLARRRVRWARSGRTQTRIIRGQVLSVHIDLVVAATKIAASHHAGSRFLRLATAFGPTASIGLQATDRTF
jgi:hypothetical protein